MYYSHKLYLFFENDLKRSNENCVKDLCIGELLAIKDQGSYKVNDIEDEEFMGFSSNKFKSDSLIHMDQLDVRDDVRGGDTVKIESCEDGKRTYTCTAINGYQVIGMKYNFEKDLVQPYLNK